MKFWKAFCQGWNCSNAPRLFLIFYFPKRRGFQPGDSAEGPQWDPLSSVPRDRDQKVAAALCSRETTAAGLGPAYGGVLGVSEGALKKNFHSSRKGQHRQCQEGKSAEGGTRTLKAHFKPLQCVNLMWILILKTQTVKKKLWCLWDSWKFELWIFYDWGITVHILDAIIVLWLERTSKIVLIF